MAPNAGEAILQTDVVALEGAFAATSTSMYVQGPLGYLRPLASGGFGSIVPAGCGDFWCSPEVLATVRERSDDEVTIIRGPVEVAGSAPTWLRSVQTMTYQGQTVYTIPGTMPSPFPVTLQAEVVSVQAESSVVKWTFIIQGAPSIPAYTASGVHQHMGFWLPQTALEIDEVGDVDKDPETGIAITVIQNDQNGIVFEETNGRDYQRVLNYDKATGKLLESRKEQLT